MALTNNGTATRRTEGKAIDLVVPSGQTWTAGKPVFAQGWHGIALGAGAQGEAVAVEIEPSVHEVDLGASITGAKGDIIYINPSTGALTSTAAAMRAFGKVVLAKDSTNKAYLRILENRVNEAA